MTTRADIAAGRGSGGSRASVSVVATSEPRAPAALSVSLFVAMLALGLGLGFGLGVPLNDANSKISQLVKKIDPRTTADCSVSYLYTNGFNHTLAFDHKVEQCIRVRYQTHFDPAALAFDSTNMSAVRQVCTNIVTVNNAFWSNELNDFMRFVHTGVQPAVASPVIFEVNSPSEFCMATTTVRDVSDFIRYPQCEAYFAMVALVAGESDGLGGSCTFWHLKAICDLVHAYMNIYRKSVYCQNMSAAYEL